MSGEDATGSKTIDGQDVPDAQMRDRLDQLRFALETTDAIVWDWDLTTDEVTFLPPERTLYGTEIATVDDFLAQVYPDDREDVRTAIRTAFDGDGEYTVEFRARTDRGLRWIADTGRVRYDDGTPTRMVGVAQDITPRKRYEHLVSHVLRHNIRNDMAIVTGYAKQLAAAIDDDTLTGYVDAVQTAAADLAQLGETASRLAEIIQPSPTSPDAINVSALVRDLAADLDQDHPTADLQVNAPDDVPVAADDSLRYVLREALENAVVHNEAPTIEVTVTATRPPRVEITDDGTGVPDLELEALDDETPVTDLCHGEGLGLALIKWGVEALDGDIAVTSDGAAGTTITIELPPAPGSVDDTDSVQAG